MKVIVNQIIYSIICDFKSWCCLFTKAHVMSRNLMNIFTKNVINYLFEYGHVMKMTINILSRWLSPSYAISNHGVVSSPRHMWCLESWWTSSQKMLPIMYLMRYLDLECPIYKQSLNHDFISCKSKVLLSVHNICAL